MRYVAAYLLSALGGNASPQAADIKKILESVGIEADNTRMEKVVTELGGKNVEEVIAQGDFEYLCSMYLVKMVLLIDYCDLFTAEEKKEAKEESEEGSDDDMGFGLFD
uniref:Large ribosomal subunit protein P2 n=1 Tax=Hucho hucho TaxID=62062 RepID=A0A4W5LUJ3_9TELE